MSKYIPVDPEKWAAMVQAQSENRLLKVEVQHWQEQWHFVIQDNNKQMDENARLKAEVERLRKAGDALAKVIDDDYLNTLQVWIDWNAAKEGKPSV